MNFIISNTTIDRCIRNLPQQVHKICGLYPAYFLTSPGLVLAIMPERGRSRIKIAE